MEIKRVGILGAGVMGAQIAAHLTNAKIPVYAFDMSQDVAKKGVEAAVKIKPAAFYNPKNVEMITPLNYDDHLYKLKECDWIIEVIAEKIEWKHGLYKRISPHVNPNSIVTSNTSGLAASTLVDTMDASMKKRFFITHFFNPPRYMKLVEIITHADTDQSLIKPMADFLENVLGKGVVYAKDTPNFVANRIGVFGMMATLEEAYKRNLSIEDVDALTGALIGRPKSATFRTADVVGLDTLSFVAKTAYDNCLEDEEREGFKLPNYITKMLDNNWLGQKSGQGFYKKIEKGVIHSIDLKTLEYSPQSKSRYGSVRIARENINPAKRFNALVNGKDIAGEFIWAVTSRALLYAANRLPEIADDIVNIDNAMKWGFAWSKGPFEVWDDLGVLVTIERMKLDGRKIPEWVNKMTDSGFTEFYDYIDGKECYYDPQSNAYQPVVKSEKEFSFSVLKKNNKIIKQDWSASLVDLGDGIAGLEFHSVLNADLNPIDGSIMQSMQSAVSWVKDNGYNGLVISGDSTNFSAGANLNIILNAAQRKDWSGIELVSKHMQDVTQMVRFSSFPVVAAPFGLVLGGGFEVIGACDKIVAAAESYIGLVEVGVGLIPGAGGNLRMIRNLSEKIKSPMPGAFPVVQKVFEVVGFAKVATSAKKAQAYGYLRKSDEIVINRGHILHRAKQIVLEMAPSYVAPEIDTYKLPGTSGRLVLDGSIKGFLKSKKISEHDAHIAKKLGYVLTGGDKGGPFSPVDEQYLLDIEREAFVSLCGEPKSIARIEYMLTKGKPLRN